MPRLLVASLLFHVVFITLAARMVQRGTVAPAAAFVVEQVDLASPEKATIPGLPGPVGAPLAQGKKSGPAPAQFPVSAAQQSTIHQQVAALPPVVKAAPAAGKPAPAATASHPAAGVGTPASAAAKPQPPGTERPSAAAAVGAAGVSSTGAAAGEGGRPGGRTAASGKGAGAGTPSVTKVNYQALLKRLIETHKQYPAASRRRSEEGSCQRRFVLGRDGTLRQVEALTRCGHPFLDEAATRAITSVEKFPAFPEELAGGEASFTVSLTFTVQKP